MIGFKKSYISWIALRQIFSSRRRAGLSFMTIASVVGTTIGVAALVIVLSVMGGFEKDLKSRIFKGLPHLEIFNQNSAAGFSLDTYPVSKFENVVSQSKNIEPFTRSDVVLKHDKRLASVTMFGIDDSMGGQPWGFSDAMIAGQITQLSSADLKSPGIILGEALSVQLGVDVGDFISAISPQMSIGDALGGQRFTQQLEVVGIFRTDIPNYDSKYVAVKLNTGRKFMQDYDESMDSENYVSGIAATFSDPEHIDKNLNIAKLPNEFQVVTWKDVNKSLIVALKLEKFAMGSVLFLIVVVAAFSIAGTIMMTVYYKRHQISLLRALGMRSSDIMRLFIAHGAFIGGVGVVLGFSLGLGICWFIASIDLLNLPQGVYLIKKLPVRFLDVEYVIIGIGALVLSLAASIYPALTAAKQEPSNGLRYS